MLRGIAMFIGVCVIGVGGYFAIDHFGARNVAEVVDPGLVTDVWVAPESQCSEAKAQGDGDPVVRCVPDREWQKAVFQGCIDGDESSHAYVDADGVLKKVGKCSEADRRHSKEAIKEPIPADFSIADQVDAAAADSEQP